MAALKMTDREGISIRLIRQFDPEADARDWKAAGELPLHDKAFMLAMADEREIPFSEKITSAFAFLKRRIQ